VNLSNFGMDPVTLAGSLETKLQVVKAAGFSQIMLWGRDLVEHPRGFAAAVQVVRASGLRVTGLQVIRDYEGLSGPLHDYKLDVVKSTLEMCQAVRAPLLIVCSATSSVVTEDDGRIDSDLRKLANLAVPLGVRIGYKAVPWGKRVSDNSDAWDVVERINHANLSLVIDSFHVIANETPLDSLEEIDPRKIALVQLADFSIPAIHGHEAQRMTANHLRVFPGEGVHGGQVAEFVRRIDHIGYRGDYNFLVFNDDYQQLPPHVVVDRARRSVKWVTDQVLRRSLPLRNSPLA